MLLSKRWHTGVVFMQPGVKVNGAYYCDVLLLKKLLPDICQAAGDFCFPPHHACTKAQSCCDTRLRSSHQMWPPNRPDLSSVDYRLLSHSGMPLSETAGDVKHRWWAVIINRMKYISQGRAETPIRRGGQLCCSSIANLLQYLCAKNYQNTVQFDKVIATIFGCNVLPHSVVATLVLVLA